MVRRQPSRRQTSSGRPSRRREQCTEIVSRLLDEYVPDPQPALVHCSAFTLLVAVLLSAQCTDERVNLVTKDLFARASDAKAMDQLSEEEILEAIRTCGLARSKARYIKELSSQLCERHGGEVPANFQELEALSGIGHKSASVVMSQAFGLPAFAVDTHIFRCSKRWGLSKHKSVEGVERDLKKCFPESSWSRRHLQIILFARMHCPARGHEVKRCPICSEIEALA